MGHLGQASFRLVVDDGVREFEERGGTAFVQHSLLYGSGFSECGFEFRILEL